jgi:hypothetical protein
MTKRPHEFDTLWGGNYRTDHVRQIKIGEKYSYGDWGLFLAPNPEIEPVSAKIHLVDIPAGDGSLDLTEALTGGEPKYNNRKITFSLIFSNPEDEWDSLRREIENYCNGKKLPIIMSEDMEHYFIGRIAIKGFIKDKSIAILEFEVDCEPYRYKNELTKRRLTVQGYGEADVNLINERRCVIPQITVDQEVTVIFGDFVIVLTPGAWHVSGLMLKPGDNRIKIQTVTDTNITIEYREASL